MFFFENENLKRRNMNTYSRGLQFNLPSASVVLRICRIILCSHCGEISFTIMSFVNNKSYFTTINEKTGFITNTNIMYRTL